MNDSSSHVAMLGAHSIALVVGAFSFGTTATIGLISLAVAVPKSVWITWAVGLAFTHLAAFAFGRLTARRAKRG